MEAKKKNVQPSSKTVPWWRELFKGGFYRVILNSIPPKQTLAEVKFIAKALELKKGDSLLDVCCGIGRHLIPIAKRGIKTTGVDLSPEYLQEAARKAEKARVNLNLICEDIRKIKFRNRFSGVINMWASIGFFDREIDNFKVIKAAYQALKPGGRFLLHTANRDQIIRNFIRRDWWNVGDCKILDEREFDLAAGRMNSTRTFIWQGKEVQKKISLRIYCFHELREYFRKAGFEEIAVYGGRDFSPLTFDSPMLFIVGKKPR